MKRRGTRMESFDSLSRGREQRYAIFLALVDMMRERDSLPSAQELADRCFMSRATFYRYFGGVKDVANWYQQYTAALCLHRIGRSFTVTEGHRLSLALLAKGAPLFSGYVRWWNYDYSLPSVLGHVKAMNGVLAEHEVALTAKVAYEVEGIAMTCHQLVAKWFNDGMNLPVDDLAEIIASFYPAHLREVFDKTSYEPDIANVVDLLLGGSGNEIAQDAIR